MAKTSDLFQSITDRVIEQLERGVIPWRKSWMACGSCVSHNDGRKYSVLNCMLIGMFEKDSDLSDGQTVKEFATFNQVKAEGGSVVKGSKAKPIVFFKPIKKPKKDNQGNIILKPDGSPEEDIYFVLRRYSVFRVGVDTTGVSLKYANAEKLPCVAQRIERIDKIIDAYVKGSGLKLVYEKGDKACYTPALDRVTMPLPEQFYSTEEMYSCLSHECGHSTGHVSRLNRGLESNVSLERYSAEELLAEMFSCALLSYCSIDTEASFSNSVAYLGSWLSVLKNDKRMIVSAATKAQKALELVLSYSNEVITTNELDEEE